VKNRVSLVSDTPDVVDVCAVELTDTRDEGLADPYPVVFDNATRFNHLRGTESQLLLTPDGPDTVNMSRNLGDNRGHGAHPSAFEPGGNWPRPQRRLYSTARGTCRAPSLAHEIHRTSFTAFRSIS
jgi:hypothetical protein